MLLLALVFAACGKTSAPSDPNAPMQLMVPDHGAYTGAYMDFGDIEDVR